MLRGQRAEVTGRLSLRLVLDGVAALVERTEARGAHRDGHPAP